MAVFFTTFLMGACALGFGVWFRHLGQGAVLLVGNFAIVLLLFVLSTLAAMPVSICAWTVLALSTFSLLAFGYKHFPRTQPLRLNWYHPTIVLPIAVAILALFAEVDEPYIPHSWDEMSGWGTWTQQILAANTWWHPEMENAYSHYPKGWPLAMAFPQVFLGDYNGTRGVAVGFILHVGALGALFDYIVSKAHEADVPNVSPNITGWVVILVLLALQATWHLIPFSLEIERPVLYTAIGLFALGGLASRYRSYGRLFALAMGIVLAAAFSMKTPAIALAVPVLLLMPFSHVSNRERIFRLVGAFLPLGILFYGWPLVSPEAHAVSASKFELVEIVMIAERVVAELKAYLISYKFVFSLLAIVGFLWALKSSPKDRQLVLAISVFVIVYFAGLIYVYAGVVSAAPDGPMPSLPRYARLPLRIIHTFGLSLLAIALFRSLRTVIKMIPPTSVLLLSGIAVALAGGWQAYRASIVIADLPHKKWQTTDNISRIKQMHREVESLATVVTAERLSTPRVVFVAQSDDGYLLNAASYYFANPPMTGTPQRFRMLRRAWSWGAIPTNAWMRKTTLFDLEALFRENDIIWPVISDAWIAPVLERLSSNPFCRANPTQFFFVKDPGSSSGFRCVPKAA